jgi:hypothetical protein
MLETHVVRTQNRCKTLLNSSPHSGVNASSKKMPLYLSIPKIRFFQKIGFLTGISVKKIRFFQKIGFLTGINVKKIRFFQKIGFLTGHQSFFH